LWIDLSPRKLLACVGAGPLGQRLFRLSVDGMSRTDAITFTGGTNIRSVGAGAFVQMGATTGSTPQKYQSIRFVGVGRCYWWRGKADLGFIIAFSCVTWSAINFARASVNAGSRTFIIFIIAVALAYEL